MIDHNIKNKKYKNALIIISLIVIIICLLLLLESYKNYINELNEKSKIDKLKSSYQSTENYDKSDETNNIDSYFKIKQNNLNNNNCSHDAKNSDYINNNTVNERNNSQNNRTNNNSEDCIIEIPDIDLSKIVYTGEQRENHLANYELVTASSDMKYINGGNYIICGHASRLYGHSLNRLKEVHKGTLIRIWAKYGLDEYEVKKVYFDDMDKTSDYCRQSKTSEITIVSCAKYISANSYIIVKATKK